MKQAIYTLTPRRTGTVYLTALLQQNLPHAAVYHERTGFPHFGVNTPDASHTTTFNHVGNVELIQKFWSQKLKRDADNPAEWIVEISHHLAKAGMIENFDFLRGERRIRLILLRRDPLSVAWIYINRFEFINNGCTWLFSLGPAYPRRIIDSTSLPKQGMFGNAIWYVNEVYARQAYYLCLLKNDANANIYSIDLADIITANGVGELLSVLTGQPIARAVVKMPDPQNESKGSFFDHKVKADVKQLLSQLWQDPDKAGLAYFESGRRLGDPAR